MPKIGINISIDVTKIDKARLYKGEKGTYLNLTTFIDTTEANQYGDHGFISQAVSKEEREAGKKGEILGNCKVFYNQPRTADSNDSHGQATPTTRMDPNVQDVDPIDDLPF